MAADEDRTVETREPGKETSDVIRDDSPPDDTSGGPLSSDAGAGSGLGAEGAPDVDVRGEAPDAGGATDDAEGGIGGSL